MNAKPEGVKAKAKKLLCQGVSPTEVARSLPISRATIYRWKKEWQAEELAEGIVAAQVLARPRNLTAAQEEKARRAASEPAVMCKDRCFRGPRDREQYLECLAEAGGDPERVRRRSSCPNEPWIVSTPDIEMPRSRRAVFQRAIFGSQRTGQVGRLAREAGRARRIQEALTPEYCAEVARLREKARKAIAYDVEPRRAHVG